MVVSADMAIATTDSTLSPDIAALSQCLDELEVESVQGYDFIDTCAALSVALDALHPLPTRPPSIYIDLEGEKLSRHGTISIMQIFVLPLRHVYLIDIHVLRHEAFTVRGSTGGETLKNILESRSIPKVIFDVRNDSDALYKHYNIRLAGIQDLQLMELATRPRNRTLVNGLARCIERDASLPDKEKAEWIKCKERGVELFAPEHGGSFAVFSQRPLSEDIIQYCIQDVQFLPQLWARYDRAISPKWRDRAKSAAMERVSLSQSAHYESFGEHKTLGPKKWRFLR